MNESLNTRVKRVHIRDFAACCVDHKTLGCWQGHGCSSLLLVEVSDNEGKTEGYQGEKGTGDEGVRPGRVSKQSLQHLKETMLWCK